MGEGKKNNCQRVKNEEERQRSDLLFFQHIRSLTYQNASEAKLFHICAQHLTASRYLVPFPLVASLETLLHLHVSVWSCWSVTHTHAHASEQPYGLLLTNVRRRFCIFPSHLYPPQLKRIL